MMQRPTDGDKARGRGGIKLLYAVIVRAPISLVPGNLQVFRMAFGSRTCLAGVAGVAAFYLV